MGTVPTAVFVYPPCFTFLTSYFNISSLCTTNYRASTVIPLAPCLLFLPPDSVPPSTLHPQQLATSTVAKRYSARRVIPVAGSHQCVHVAVFKSKSPRLRFSTIAFWILQYGINRWPGQRRIRLRGRHWSARCLVLLSSSRLSNSQQLVT